MNAPYDKNNPKSIQQMFGSIAQQYDKMNALLSLQMHRYWNKNLIRHTLLKQNPQSYLDLCCGTGEISLNYLQNRPTSCHAYLLDFCPEMLMFAKERAKHLKSNPHHLTYLEADAQAIPLTDATIECATMAYGIRNIPNTQLSFNEIYRVLKSGGTLGILELTQPNHFILRWGHGLYLKTVLPLMGKLVAANEDAYKYLCNSIKSFVKPEELDLMLAQAGFKHRRTIPLMGGIATLLIAKK